MKYIILFLVVTFSLTTSDAQRLDWAKKIGNTGFANVESIVVDSFSNTYVLGTFGYTVDFDPSNSVYNLSSNLNSADVFLSKYDIQGDFVWAKKIGSDGGDNGISMQIDPTGNIYITGTYEGTVDFNTGAGVYNLVSLGASLDIFIAKYDLNGDFLWAGSIGGINTQDVEDLEIDDSGNVFILGNFSATTDFDPSAAINNLTTSGTSDFFIVKLDSLCNFLWAKKVGGTNIDNGSSLQLDQDGNVYITGFFKGTTDFNPGIGIFNLSSTSVTEDIFVLKLNAVGNFRWAFKLGGSNGDFGQSIEVDNDGKVIITGKFQGNVDFDPGTGSQILSCIGATDLFVLKIDSLSNYLWAKSYGGVSSTIECYSSKVDSNNDIFITGFYTYSPIFSSLFFTDTLNSLGSHDIYVCKIQNSGEMEWIKSFGGTGYDIGLDIALDRRNNLICSGTFQNNVDFDFSFYEYNLTAAPINSTYVIKLNQNGVAGRVYLDLSLDCNQDANETSLLGRRLIVHPTNFIVETNEAGFWYIDSLPIGNYSIEVDSSKNWETTCSGNFNFSVNDVNIVTYSPSIGMINTNPCTAPDISVFTPNLRRCFTDQKIYLQVSNSNLATEIISSPYVDVKLDSLIVPTSASINFTTLGYNAYRFILDPIYPGQSFNFWMNTSVSCDAILSQTLCIEANLFPLDSCVLDTIQTDYVGNITPCTFPWDRSTIILDGWCQNDSIYFVISNIGPVNIGDMDCYSPVRIFMDGQLIIFDSIKLEGSDSDTLIFSGDGRTWRLEVDQHPLHPGNSHPNITIELCGNQSNWISDLINILPHDDADPIKDIYCGLVSGSFDPNDKTGYPLGITDTHFIAPNQHIEYTIRFQNTGTDTAFIVTIRDTLQMDFNIFSVVSGASSHNYYFTMHGPRVLEWTFPNIMLPDSTTDEPGSHGFVTFSVEQNSNLSPGTELNNEVGIYFDYNDPVITNTTSHVIKFPESILNFSGTGNYSETGCNLISYNGMNYDLSGTYYQIQNDSLFYLDLTIVDVDLSVNQNGIALFSNNSGASYQWLDCNNGYSTILNATNQSFTPIANGSYSVAITENGCTDTSACFTISTIGVSENTFGENIRIYPNPSTGKIFIDLGIKTEKMNVSVKNAIGQIIYSESYQNKNILELNLNVERGIYFVELTANDSSKFIYKMIVEL